MTYTQWFDDCPDHDDCIRHVGEGTNEQGAFRTESHASADIDPAFRLNLDYPDSDDRRTGAAKADRVQWALADDAAIASESFPWTDDDRRQVAVAAAAKGLSSVAELAVIAKVDAVALEADVQAFIALAADVGVAEALAVADETILAEPVPADPKVGRVRG